MGEIRPLGSGARAYELLRHAIVRLDLPPSAAVSEQQLGDRFGLSKAAVRAALARLRADGLVVAYSTNSGNVAEDGTGTRNSPFTKALLEFIETPGLEVGVLFRRVMGSVKQATGGRQHPELSILLDSEFYFKPGS